MSDDKDATIARLTAERDKWFEASGAHHVASMREAQRADQAEAKLAEVTAERDAARDEGFAQGIEAAAQYVSQKSFEWRYSSPWGGTDLAKDLRALSPTPPVDVNEIPVHYQQAGLSLTDDPQTPQADPADMPSPEEILDLIGELGREVFYLLDDCETSGPVGQEVHTITGESLKKVSDLLDRIDALPFEEPGCILGTGAMLQEAVKRTLSDRHQQADPVREAAEMPRAWLDVMGERVRQIAVEGWDDIHDDCNDKAELAQAAACYALSGTPADEAVFIHGRWNDPRDLFWPWDRSWWKPTDRRRDLVKAGALILAEIERLDRAARPSATEGSDD